MNKAQEKNTAKPAPTQARAQARRKAILDAALRLIEESGVAGVTTTSIALAANIPVGSVYRYFEDRNDILQLLYSDAYAEVETSVINAAGTIGPSQSIRSIFDALMNIYWQAAHNHPNYRELTRWANAHHPMWQVTAGPESSLGKFVDVVLATAGVILPKARKEVAMKTIVPTISLLIDQALEQDNKKEADALIQEIGQLVDAYITSIAV